LPDERNCDPVAYLDASYSGANGLDDSRTFTSITENCKSMSIESILGMKSRASGGACRWQILRLSFSTLLPTLARAFTWFWHFRFD
jgi:hypothetical protein